MLHTTRTNLPPLASRRNAVGAASIVGVFLLLFGLSFIGIQTLSSIRGYVLGEGLWSKAQKRAVVALQRYAFTGDQADYRIFLDEIEVPLANRVAREEMENEEPDTDLVRESLLRGGTPEPFLDGMIVLFWRFQDFGFIGRAIDVWAVGDEAIEELIALAERLRVRRDAGPLGQDELDAVLRDIGTLDSELTRLEEEFSRELIEGSFRVERALLSVLSIIALVFAMTAALAGRLMYRQVRSRETALQASEARYRTLFQENVVGVVVTTPGGRVIEANRAFAQMVGYDDPEELEDVDAATIYADPEDRKNLVSRLRMEGTVRMREIEVRRKDGGIGWLMTSSILLGPKEGTEEAILATSLDVTEQKRLEHRLARSDRMEAMGQLAGGIAHDFNNLLTAIRGNAELLRSEIGDGLIGPGAHETVDELLKSASTASGLTKQLLSFSRGDPSTPVVVDLGRLVRETHALLERLLPGDISLTVDAPGEGRPRLEASRAQLEQVILNLALNGRDAMPSGGRLSIEVDTVEVGARETQGDSELAPGSYARLVVTDEGEGMEPEVKGRIFEPFFSTKSGDSHSGMGLATVYGIVSQCGGAITVDSARGIGTTVTVFFPTTERLERADGQARIATSEQRSGTILIVEDNQTVRDVAARVVERSGYRALVAETAERALELLTSIAPSGLPVAVLTDVVMPGMDGPALAAEIRSAHPNIRILFMSGYAVRDAISDATFPNTAFLAKPWGPGELVAALDALLSGPSGSESH